jgi:tetratricopeptide (TPR) repeat protein
VGPDHPDVATALNNLAELYRAQGRYDAAELLLQRIHRLQEAASGGDHPDVGVTLNNLALLYEGQGRYADAEPLYQRALAITERALGSLHPEISVRLNNLAEMYRLQRRYSNAEPLYQRAIAIAETAFGPNHPSIGTTLNNLAIFYESQGRYAEAERLYQRALSIAEKGLGPDHRDVGIRQTNLALLYLAQADWARATQWLQRSTSVAAQRTRRGGETVGRALTGKTESEAARQRFAFLALVKAARRLGEKEPARAAELARQTFQTAQWASTSEARPRSLKWLPARRKATRRLPASCASGRNWWENGERVMSCSSQRFRSLLRNAFRCRAGAAQPPRGHRPGAGRHRQEARPRLPRLRRLRQS